MIAQEALFSDIRQELMRGYAKHGGRHQWGRHEFYGILKEEVDELWGAIKSDAPQHEVEREATHVAAVVFRYLESGDRYREPAKYLCAVCHQNPVDAEHGYDTCDDCLRRV